MADQLFAASKPKKVPHLRVPILLKITIPYLILSLILALVAAYVITQLVSENVQERFNKQVFEAGKISSELMVRNESKLLETLRLLANVQGVPSAIVSNDPDALKTLTLGIIANNQQEAVEFLDDQGSHVLSLRHRSGYNPEDYELSTGGQTLFSNLDIVKNVLAGKSDARGDKFAGLVTIENENFLYVSGPVFTAQNYLAGVVLVGRSLPSLAADMHTQTFAQISYYDPSGQVIDTTLPFSYNLPQEMVSQTVSFKDSSSTQRDLSVADIAFTEILGSWEVRGNNQIGVLGVALSKNILVETSTASRGRIFLLAAVSFFLIILVGINLANTITRPLLQLVRASKKVADGDLEIMINPQSNDEVAILADSFNTMVANLNQSQKHLIQSYDETLHGWANALELRDKETKDHSDRVVSLTVRLARAMGIQGEELVNIRRGAMLHDIGKMGTSDDILHKNGLLNEEERRVIRKHPQEGYDVLKQIDFLASALDIPYCHHEKWDGTGYPRCLTGEEIPISARIFAIVDVFDAMTSDRPYRKAMPLGEVMAYLKTQSSRHFDPNVAEAFIRLMDSSGEPQNA